MGIEAGRLKHLVDVQQYVPAQDQSTGEQLTDESNWATEATNVFAEVQALSGRDYNQAMQAGYVVTHRVTIRWRPGIKVKTTRFLYEGAKLYVVHPVDLEGQKYGLEVLCRSGDQV